MASKRRNMFHKNKTQETTENIRATCHPFVNASVGMRGGVGDVVLRQVTQLFVADTSNVTPSRLKDFTAPFNSYRLNDSIRLLVFLCCQFPGGHAIRVQAADFPSGEQMQVLQSILKLCPGMHDCYSRLGPSASISEPDSAIRHGIAITSRLQLTGESKRVRIATRRQETTDPSDYNVQLLQKPNATP
ncbi:hypothetical protein AAG570_011195 [Ranatra chinensis]|uniref:Uncharacterized protein n=1 Tax=Ranatra chinensis TaxID=642074 RepID=A0ABD0YJW5_9HEMI